MKNRFCCNLWEPARVSSTLVTFLLWSVALVVLGITPAVAGSDAPQWMHAVVNAPVPPHDEKTDAVLLYSDTNVNVISTDKIKTTVREAYKILRPGGREYGTVMVYLRSDNKVTSI